MPSKKQYNLVNDDAYDSRIPLHSEEAFQHGINFHAKYIGTLDVPRPNSRVEIVAAMRRIRYEFKAKSIKKKKVTIIISVEGVKVVIRKKKKKNQWQWDDSRFMVMQHPIYRIFYVSHDSQDLKIFSYIARDGGSNAFKCNVFKSSKKSQAMRIVRTVGQAFEVCHKLSLAHATSMSGSPEDEEEESLSEKGSSMQDAPPALEPMTKSRVDGVTDPTVNHTGNHLNNNNNNNPVPVKDTRPGRVEPLAPPINQSPSKNIAELGETYSSPHAGAPLPVSGNILPEGTPLSVHHQLQLLREQLEQQTQQSQAIDAQLHLLKDQLAAETTARMDAQAQNSHLLSHNRELLEHIRVLVRHIQDLERKLGNDKPNIADISANLESPRVPLTENSSGTTTPSPASLHLPGDVCPSDISPTLSRSISASANAGTQDIWLRKSGNSSSTPSTLGHQGLANTASGTSPSNSPRTNLHSDQGFPLSLPSSPTPSSITTNLEELLKQSALRINSTGQLQASSINSGSIGRQSGYQESSFMSPLPRLNPPPQKSKVTKNVSNLDLPPSTPAVSYNSPVSRSSSTSSSWTDSVLPPPSADSIRSDVLSWPPGSQVGTLLRQYSLPSSQHSAPHSVGSNSDNFVSQALRDLTKLNLLDNNRELLRGIESHLNSHADTLNKS